VVISGSTEIVPFVIGSHPAVMCRAYLDLL